MALDTSAIFIGIGWRFWYPSQRRAERDENRECKKLAAAVVGTATAVATTGIVAAAAENQDDQDDDAAAVVGTKQIVTHIGYLLKSLCSVRPAASPNVTNVSLGA